MIYCKCDICGEEPARRIWVKYEPAAHDMDERIKIANPLVIDLCRQHASEFLSPIATKLKKP